MATQEAAYAELSAYTLGRGDPQFLHQHVVDAYAVQTATTSDRPIRAAQGLIGLYLHAEHRLTGRQVQRVHQILADQRPAWPAFPLPPNRGSMTVRDVVAQPHGDRRDAAIEAWIASTWGACRDLRQPIEAFLSSHGITPPGNASQARA